MSSRILVAAIDFGTTFSSWGFSFKHDYELNPTKITIKQWTGLHSLVSLKGPTTILIKPDGKTFDSFGYDAETKYAELAEDGQHKDWYYFKRFKMQLFDKIVLSRDFYIDDATGKQLKAKTVFSLSIRYLKDDLFDMSNRQVLDVLEKDIHWVLTVPAIWNDVAKQFMRESAEDAGLKTENVTIALEPECASLYCQHVPTTKKEISLGKLSEGNKYIILDAGGGTIDITAHQIMPEGVLKEIHQATGCDWGGTKVDEAFEDFLYEITDEEVMDALKDVAMEDYLDLMRSFEVKKREMKASSDRPVTINIPSELVSQTEKLTGMTIQDKIQHSKYKDKVQLKCGKLKVNHDIIRGFFEESVKNTISHLDDLCRKPHLEDCQAIVMVGGYSESSVLQERIRSHFHDKCIIIPADAGSVVLKGAVMFGHNPSLIAERICKFTYGTDVSHEKSILCTHRQTRTFIAEGMEMCGDIFHVHVRAGDVVKVGDWQEERAYLPVHRNQTSMRFDIYCTKDRSPELVTDRGCVELGYVRLPMPDTTDDLHREVFASFLFGGTELEVKVHDKSSGEERKISLSFLR